ncbi:MULTISPECIES: hypothetical protein [Vibrio]|uniref:hypothetical protein n=1 Tax=Vibrio TaxID=662 RepID=UPI000C1629B1|nr:MULTISPECIES: hypothetical protein [Vibrio]NNN43755.1 hypothetical protein [Vibrio sp. 1-1(7)]NNN71579.1 hypothetical protein [Vibrio sp. 12-2(3-a)]
MPSERLTKHRLVQITITLTILLVAFIWRTITHDDVVTLDCVIQPKCSLIVNEKVLTITRKENDEVGYSLYYPIEEPWTITPKENVIKQERNRWLVSEATSEIYIVELGIKIRLLSSKSG